MSDAEANAPPEPATEQASPANGAAPSAVARLRATLGLTLEGMGDRIGLSKSQMHAVETTGRASLRVALAIEALSDGAIDAAALSEDVRLSRHGLEDGADAAAAATGKAGDVSPAQVSA